MCEQINTRIKQLKWINVGYNAFAYMYIHIKIYVFENKIVMCVYSDQIKLKSKKNILSQWKKKLGSGNLVPFENVKKNIIN